MGRIGREVWEFKREGLSQISIPLYLNPVPAGFPSPAEDYLEGGLDLNEYLVRNPAATFMVRVSGDSMIGAGIQDGDVLVVDRSIEPAHGRIVVAVLDGELAVKRLHLRDGECRLVSENRAYKDIRVGPEQDLHVWGVVAAVVRRCV
jgi:DNA polymerase V